MPPLSSVIAFGSSPRGCRGHRRFFGGRVGCSFGRRFGRGVAAFAFAAGKTERLAALLASLEQMFGYLSHVVFLPST